MSAAIDVQTGSRGMKTPMNADAPRVDRVQDTARWVAMARAQESERKDALFTDPFARKLAGPVGAELVQKLSGRAGGTWPIVARTHIIDRLVSDAVRDGADSVLNLAAGLDSRPFRMVLPQSLTWIEVDHADVIAEKETCLRDSSPVCRLERVAQDLSAGDDRRSLFAKLGGRFRRLLVLTEGLLCYLEPQAVMDLVRDIRAIPGLFRWIADINNKAVNDYVARRTGHALQGTAKMQFGPDNGPLVFEPLGWKTVGTTSIFKTAGRLKRLPFPMSLFARLPERPYGTPGRPWSGVCVWEPTA
jgi:methyltransferase (TIGR00027 family)